MQEKKSYIVTASSQVEIKVHDCLHEVDAQVYAESVFLHEIANGNIEFDIEEMEDE